MTLARSLLTFAAGLGIAGLLVPTRTRISSLLERLQYRGTFGKRRALSELGRELLHERDLGMLCSALLRQIEDGVDLERTNLYLTQGEALLSIRPQPELPDAPLVRGPRRRLLAAGRCSSLSGLALPVEALSPAQRLFIAGYRYAFPLTVRGRGIGIVLASFKRDGSPLNSDDTELIRHLLNQAALAIENAQLVGQLHLQLEEVRNLQRYSEGIFESSPGRHRGARRGVPPGVGQRGIRRHRRPADREALPGRVLSERAAGRVAALHGTGPGRDEPLPIRPAASGTCRSACRSSNGQTKELQALRVLVVHDVTERVAMENALKEQDRLAALGMLAAGRGPRGQYADHRHLQLRPDAALGHARGPSALRDPEEGRAADLPRRADRQQPARVRPPAPERARRGGDRPAPHRVRGPAGGAAGEAADRGRLGAARAGGPGDGLRRRAAAGVHEPDPERVRCHDRARGARRPSPHRRAAHGRPGGG